MDLLAGPLSVVSERNPSGEWSYTLSLEDGQLKPGWYEINADFAVDGRSVVIFLDFGRGLSEAYSAQLNAAKAGGYSITLKIPRSVVAMRFVSDDGVAVQPRRVDAVRLPGAVVAARLLGHAVSVMSADPAGFARRIPTYLEALRQPSFLRLSDSAVHARTQPIVSYWDWMRPLLQPFSVVRRRRPRKFVHSDLRMIRWLSASRVTDITVVTPTGDRPAAFNKCVQWVTTQTVRPAQWVIVDDGYTPLSDFISFPDWVTYIRRERTSEDADHTLSDNIMAALPHIRHDKIAIFEDDDWYARDYLDRVSRKLEEWDLVGNNKIVYYHLAGKVWKTGKPKRHTAFAQTAFTKKVLPVLSKVCRSGDLEIRRKGLVDRHLWHSFEGRKHLVSDEAQRHVGLKGLGGRPGIAEGHSADSWGYRSDEHLEQFDRLVGQDRRYYQHWAAGPRNRFAVYTAIAGNYDVLREPRHDNPDFDFFVFSDKEIKSDRWKWIPFDFHDEDPVRMAKRPKILPNLYFQQYEVSIWVDANIFITGDLTEFVEKTGREPIGVFEHPERDSVFQEAGVCIEKSLDDKEKIQKQIDRYVEDGYGQNTLYECNFIVRNHNHKNCIEVMNLWWSEIERGSRRDQLSFPYALWKKGVSVARLGKKGESVRTSPTLYYSRHGVISATDYDARIERHKKLYGLARLAPLPSK